MNRAIALLLAFGVLVAPVCFGQGPTTGTPPFGTFGGGPFDTINLGNLNVHFVVPVLNKAGRGLPFSYNLSYDSSVWYPVGPVGSQTWTPVFNWGWMAQTAVHTGYVSYTFRLVNCDTQGEQYRVWDNFVYVDPWGTLHSFPKGLGHQLIYDPYDCLDGGVFNYGGTATDGSALGLSASITTHGGLNQSKITARNGSVYNPPYYAGGSATATDANGNQISVNTSGVFTDTLGTTALTVTGTGPVSLKYTAPAGSTQYTINYQSYTVATDFGISGIAEYAPAANNLVDNIQLPDGTHYKFTYEQTPGSCTPLSGTYSSYCVTARIASVTLPTGGEISYSYTGGNNGIESDGSTAGLNRTTPDSSTPWKYARSGSDPNWTTTVTDPLTNQTIINFEKDSSTTIPTNNFYETQRVVKQGSNTLSTTITCYNSNLSSCSNTAVTSPINRTTFFHYLPTSSGSQAETDTDYNSNGLVTDVYDYDYGTGSVGALLRHTNIAYWTLGNGIVDRPSAVSTYDGGGSLRAKTQYTYDEGSLTASGATQHISITGSRGNLTTVAAEASGTTTLYRKFTYYDTGILLTSSDVSTTNASTNPTTYNYSTSAASCDFAFPTSTSEPMSLSRSMTWNCNGGLLLSLTDENSKISSTAYSGTNYSNWFWRPYSTTDQSGNLTYFTYPSATQTESTLSFNSSVVGHLTTVDGLGRLSISQTEQGPGSGNYDSVETTYDANGRVLKVTMPYVAASGQLCSGTCPGTSYGYDTLNRITSVIDGGNGSTSSVYTNNDVLQTVASPTTQKQLEYDGIGRLKSVCEITSGTTQYPAGTCMQKNNQTGYWTKYTYDALGDLAGVTQNAQSTTQQTRTYLYDMLGRLASEGNPENGTTTYYWDAAAPSCGGGAYPTPGDLGTKKDNAGVYTCYGYDGLHRLLGFAPNSNTNCTGFVYDTATPPNGVNVSNTKGRLINAYTNTACNGRTSLVTDRWLGYSPRGEVTDIYSSTPNSGGYYHVTKSYWPHGALQSLGGLPGVPTIYYGASDASGLDGEGRVTKVTASSGTNPVSGVTYTNSGATQPIGSITQVTYGSSDSDNFSYDTGTGRMTGYQFNVGTSGQAVAGTLGWNSNGTLQTLNITDQFNSANAQNCTYGYDALLRINSVSCNSGSAWGQNFTYDYFGNINKSVPTGATGVSFLPTYSETTNQYSGLCGQLAYDNDGNLTNDCFHTYQWDANGRPIVIDTVNATYDGLGNLAEQDAPSWNQEYIYDENHVEIGGAVGQSPGFANIPLPGGARILYNPQASLTLYTHADWLGSARLHSTPSRTVYGDTAFAPFGETYANTNPPDAYHFADYPLNFALGLYDTPFREYHTVQGRWITPDPAGLAVVDPGNPQTWNRYAYVHNNPVSFTDPLGLTDCPDGHYGCNCPIDGCPRDYYGPGNPGNGCDPSDASCDGGPGGGGPGQGGPGPGGPSNGGGTHGPWPGNQTTGLPQLPTQPLSLGDLFGLTPGCDFGVCNPIGNGFLGAGISSAASLDPGLLNLLAGIASFAFDLSKANPSYGAGLCTFAAVPQLRGFGGCTYLCEVVTGDPTVNPLTAETFGIGHFKGPQVTAACGPGALCPRAVIIEVPDAGLGLHTANILGCVQ
jgi:RHS repeat-associated protein